MKIGQLKLCWLRNRNTKNKKKVNKKLRDI